jgi:hypothetical protein
VFLGLGVMAPVERLQDIHAFTVEDGLAPQPEPTVLIRALRRAVMARVQQQLGLQVSLPAFFSGHKSDGSLAQSARDPHLTFLFDPGSARLLVVAPHILARRNPSRDEVRYLRGTSTTITSQLIAALPRG